VAGTILLLCALSTLGCAQGHKTASEFSAQEIQRHGGKVVLEERGDGRRLVKVDLGGSSALDADMALLRELDNLDELSLRKTLATDQALSHLTSAAKVRNLDLEQTPITDAGLSYLADRTSLRGLYLAETAVTDAGLVHLRQLTKLRVLSLRDTKISDAAVEHLGRLTDLRLLDLGGTQVTQTAIGVLRAKLPGAQIRWRSTGALSALPDSVAVGVQSKTRR
jgi:hypothetical protein